MRWVVGPAGQARLASASALERLRRGRLLSRSCSQNNSTFMLVIMLEGKKEIAGNLTIFLLPVLESVLMS